MLSVAAAEYPRCNVHDPDFNACLSKAFETVLHRLKDGKRVVQSVSTKTFGLYFPLSHSVVLEAGYQKSVDY